MLSLIPLLPFTGFLINATLGRRLTKGVSGAVACLAIIIALFRHKESLNPDAFTSLKW